MSEQSPPIQPPAPSPLASALVSVGWRGLFAAADGDARVQELWTTHSASAFESLLRDEEVDAHARFLAAEVVFARGAGLPEGANADLVAAAYAGAMAGNFMGAANPWGLPNELGKVGVHLLKLGRVATPHLLPLLDNRDPVHYAGSEEATIGNSYAYRVRDLAAYFIALIEVRPYGVVKDPAERDVRIDAMLSHLSPAP